MATHNISRKYSISKGQGYNLLAVWFLEKQRRLKPTEAEINKTISDIKKIPNLANLEFEDVTYSYLRGIIVFLCFLHGINCDERRI